METMNTCLRLSGALLIAGLAAACNDDEPAGLPEDPASPATEDRGAPPDMARDGATTAPAEPDAGRTDEDVDASAPELAPRFALATQVFQGSVATSYVLTLGDVAAGALTLDGAGQELAGRAVLASPGNGVFFVGTSESPEVTRYTLDDAGEAVRGASLSFLAQGVNAIGEYPALFQFVADDKAYYFDGRSAQIVVWDPTAMRVTAAIDLGELVVAGQIVAFSSNPTRRGDDLIMPVGFRSSDNARIVGGAAAVIVHTGDDRVEIARDDRCGYVRDAVTLDDGSVYIATEAYGSAVRRIASENAPAPCVLRLLPGADDFDPDFYVDLEALAGGAAGSLVRAPDGRAYVHVLDEARAAVTPTTNPRVLASAAAWTWAEIDLADSPRLTPLPALPAMAGSILAFPIGERLYVAELASLNASTKLRDVGTADGAEVLTVPGALFSFAQVR